MSRLCNFCGVDHSIIGVDYFGNAWCIQCQDEAPRMRIYTVPDHIMKKAVEETKQIMKELKEKKSGKK